MHARQSFRPKASVQSVTGSIARFNSREINNLDRDISVAPMMDGTDSQCFTFQVNGLWTPRGESGLLYVSRDFYFTEASV
jgi:hypothetical protein